MTSIFTAFTQAGPVTRTEFPECSLTVSKHFVQSSNLRKTLIAAYRAYARAQVWRRGPRILVNSIPKAGTHLLTAELERLADLQNSRLQLDIDRLGMPGTSNDLGFPMVNLPKTERAISTVRPGQMFSAHLYWSKELEDILSGAEICSIFIARDPRDIVLSRLHYAMGLRRHRLHPYLAEVLENDKDRLRSLIVGRNADPFIRPLRATLQGYLPWLDRPGTLAVRFEDLVGQRGGGTAERKRDALRSIVDLCGIDGSKVDEMAGMGTGPTPTMRKGKAGGWRDEMPAELVELCDAEMGDLIEAYGYART